MKRAASTLALLALAGALSAQVKPELVPAVPAKQADVARNAAGRAPRAGERGAPGLAIRTAKALTCAAQGAQVIDNAVVLVRDGSIEAIGRAAEVQIPTGYELLDVGSRWLAPGMIDLHCHIGGTFDINDMVYLANPELRVATSVQPDNPSFQRALAGGVTTVLYIPGSGTNIGGQGILLKTGMPTFETSVVRDPGSLKVAQWGNPERWVMGVGKTFEAYAVRNMFARGRQYADEWAAFEKGAGPKPAVNLQYEVFREIYARRTVVSVHTQIYQVVLLTLTMLKGEFDTEVFLDHSEIGGWMAAEIAERYKVPAIVGPRSADPPSRGFINWAQPRAEGFIGLARYWQEGGHSMIGFNTDSPVVPQEELFVQALMGARLGMDNARLDVLRGLTIVPAKTAKIDHRVGSLEVGKDADILVIHGDPVDPRSAIDMVLVEGYRTYDVSAEMRRF